MKRILIVEDDKALTKELSIFLHNNGFETGYTDDFSDYGKVTEMIVYGGFDLVLLDIGLPGCDGQFILKEVRRQSDIPVIMITSRDNEVDELLSMNYGADDYVTKPFNTHILIAKIEAVLRRTGTAGANVLKSGSFSLNISECRLIGNDGEQIEITKNEMRILQYLFKNKGRIVSRDELMGYIWDSDDFVDDNTLTVNVTRVREKLACAGAGDAIVTKRGQGYMLR